MIASDVTGMWDTRIGDEISQETPGGMNRERDFDQLNEILGQPVGLELHARAGRSAALARADAGHRRGGGGLPGGRTGPADERDGTDAGGIEPFLRVVEPTDDTEDPAIWGTNFPLQYDDYWKTSDQQRTRFGGSEALPKTAVRSGSLFDRGPIPS